MSGIGKLQTCNTIMAKWFWPRSRHRSNVNDECVEMHQCLGFLCLVFQGASLDSSARFPRHIHDNGHSDPACGAQMSRKNCDISGTCQPPSSCSRGYVTRLGAKKSRSHVTRLLIGTLTIAFWSSSTQSTLVADTPIILWRVHVRSCCPASRDYSPWNSTLTCCVWSAYYYGELDGYFG